MRMQHIYQPVMIKALLLAREHRASVESIAKQFLINDEPQLEYYKYITKVMPGRVLRDHNVVSYVDDKFALNVKDRLSREQIRDLICLCDTKIEEYETLENCPSCMM